MPCQPCQAWHQQVFNTLQESSGNFVVVVIGAMGVVRIGETVTIGAMVSTGAMANVVTGATVTVGEIGCTSKLVVIGATVVTAGFTAPGGATGVTVFVVPIVESKPVFITGKGAAKRLGDTEVTVVGATLMAPTKLT
jgi:hypothetical protein